MSVLDREFIGLEDGLYGCLVQAFVGLQEANESLHVLLVLLAPPVDMVGVGVGVELVDSVADLLSSFKSRFEGANLILVTG